MSPVTVDLSDQTLFGNDAAEDESDDIFLNYVVYRPEVGEFVALENKLLIARAYKGEGKSALLRLTRAWIERDRPDDLIASVGGSDITPDLTGVDFAAWVRAWKDGLARAIAIEVGRSIGFAWSDNAISLVEEAERAGVRQRSL